MSNRSNGTCDKIYFQSMDSPTTSISRFSNVARSTMHSSFFASATYTLGMVKSYCDPFPDTSINRGSLFSVTWGKRDILAEDSTHFRGLESYFGSGQLMSGLK